MSEPRVVLNVTGLPEVIWQVRHEFADVLRRSAQDEEPRVAERLREIATAFESGCEG